MSRVQPEDLSIYPAYLCVGRPPIQQAVIAHLWRYRLSGRKMSMKDLVVDCASSSGTVKGCLNKLVEEGVLDEEYGILVDFVPERTVVPPAKPKKQGKKLPSWVFEASSMWTTGRGGVLNPGDFNRCLQAVVNQFGWGTVRPVFATYCEVSGDDAKFHTLRRFGELYPEYEGKVESDRAPGNNSMRGYLKGKR